MMGLLRDLVLDESGGALVEYALVMALVSVVGMAALDAFGGVLEQFFVDSSNGLVSAAVNAK